MEIDAEGGPAPGDACSLPRVANGRTRCASHCAWAVGISLGLLLGSPIDSGNLQSQEPTQDAPILHLADRWIEHADLQSIDSAGRLSYGVTAGTQAIDLQRVVRWERGRVSRGSSLLWLADGTWLAGELEWTSVHHVRLKSGWFESMQFELEELRGIVFNPPVDSRSFADLQRRMQLATGTADVVWNRKSEPLSGVLSLQLRPSVSDRSPPTGVWSLRATGATESAPLASESVQAIVLSPVLRSPLRIPENHVMLELVDGSQITNVQALDVSSGSHVTIELANGRHLKSLDSPAEFVSAWTRIQGEPAGVQWLSTVEPAKYRFMSEQSILAWPLGRDQDLFGRALSVDGRPVSRGLTIHAPAQVAYRWDGSDAQFLAEVSLLAGESDLGPPPGSANCRVMVARNGALIEVFKSATLRANTPAERVQVDLSGAQLLVLLAEEADQGPVGDHVLWREPRIVRPQR